MYIPSFQIPIYSGKLLLCCTRDEWASVAALFEEDEDSDACKGLAIRYRSEEEGRTYAIGIFDGAVDTFMHELAHAVFFILGDVGVPLEDGGNNECFTYLLGDMVREVFPVFQARTR